MFRVLHVIAGSGTILLSKAVDRSNGVAGPDGCCK
jgi:hypothetical protein